MNDIFASITGGLKFNKRKNGEAIGVFTGKGKSRKSSELDVLDIFSAAGQGESSASSRHSSSSACISDSTVSEAVEAVPVNFDREEDLNSFRNRLAIKARGSDIPNPVATFAEMTIHDSIRPVILRNIEESIWKEPTPIQMQAIPAMLSHRDVLAAAPTGSGKTAAFLLPVLSVVSSQVASSKGEFKGISGLILAPTKELAEQIHREATRLSTGRRLKIVVLSRKMVSSALSQNDASTFRNVDILIATPLRLLTVLHHKALTLHRVRIVVLDEADKLFELENSREGEDEDDVAEVETSNSFLTQVDEILASCTDDNLQRGLFSATIGPMVQELANRFLHNPVSISVGVENAGAENIEQKLMFVGREDGKLLAIRQLVQQGLRPPVLIFLQSKERAKQLFLELVYDGINVDVMHAERSAAQREEIIRRFRTGEIWVLICTDLMARGVDFQGVQMVINYDLPLSAVSYIHRIGRTGRAGRKGVAVTFFTEADLPKLRSIANVMKLSGCPIPDWMLSIKQMSTKQKRHLRNSAPHRRTIRTDTRFGQQERGDSGVEHVKKRQRSR